MADKNTFTRGRHREDTHLLAEKARRGGGEQSGTRSRKKTPISRRHRFSLAVIFRRWNLYFHEKTWMFWSVNWESSSLNSPEENVVTSIYALRCIALRCVTLPLPSTRESFYCSYGCLFLLGMSGILKNRAWITQLNGNASQNVTPGHELVTNRLVMEGYKSGYYVLRKLIVRYFGYDWNMTLLVKSSIIKLLKKRKVGIFIMQLC